MQTKALQEHILGFLEAQASQIKFQFAYYDPNLLSKPKHPLH